MKKIIIYISCIVLLLSSSACSDFLTRLPQDEFTDNDYWTSEVSLRSYAQDFYSEYFVGYQQDYEIFGGYFSGDSYNDDFLLTTTVSTHKARRYFLPNSNTAGINAASSTEVWPTQYKMIRKANVMLARIPKMEISDEAKEHWTAIASFFRAMAYSRLVKEFGDVPYIDVEVFPEDKDILYKDRDKRVTVVDNILKDFQTALDGARVDDGTLQVNKYVIGSFMSRWMLFHATWLKYHGTSTDPSAEKVSNETLKKYFDGAIQGAKAVIDSGKFAIGNTYNELFSSESLAGNKEIIFYREYVFGLAINNLMEYNAKQEQKQGGMTKAAIESYLCDDGLPIGQSPNYKGKDDPSIENSFLNRDPRLYVTVVDSLRIMNSGLHTADSPTGYACKKFLNEQWLAEGSKYINNSQSPADAPVIRYAEVLLNYVEARYEVSKVGGSAFVQDDLDKLNEIRGRQLTKWGEKPSVVRTMPPMTLAGNNISVNGTVINDPQRDADVDPILWEIRRERRVELMLEGRRGEDLNRWAKLDKIDSGTHEDLKDAVLGAWIKKSDYPGIRKNHFNDKDEFVRGVTLFNPNGDATKEGYIIYYYYNEIQADETTLRRFIKGNKDHERCYLRAVPIDQINEYNTSGYTLSQNYGWE